MQLKQKGFSLISVVAVNVAVAFGVAVYMNQLLPLIDKAEANSEIAVVASFSTSFNEYSMKNSQLITTMDKESIKEIKALAQAPNNFRYELINKPSIEPSKKEQVFLVANAETEGQVKQLRKIAPYLIEKLGTKASINCKEGKEGTEGKEGKEGSSCSYEVKIF